MLGTFGTKKNKSVEVSKPTFQERLGGVKSIFKRARKVLLMRTITI